MAFCRLTRVVKKDGTTRDVLQVFYDDQKIEPVILEKGEGTQYVIEGTTTIFGNSEEMLPEDLKAEVLAIRDSIERGEFVDIDHKLDK